MNKDMKQPMNQPLKKIDPIIDPVLDAVMDPFNDPMTIPMVDPLIVPLTDAAETYIKEEDEFVDVPAEFQDNATNEVDVLISGATNTANKNKREWEKPVQKPIH